MNPIDELIIKIEAYPHKVITKGYVLDRLRELQIDYNSLSDEFPIMPPNSARIVTGIIVRGGD